MTPSPVRILVWSDYVCPFCYLELPVLDEIEREFGEQVQIEWRAFELRPEPVPTLDPDGEYLHRVWGQSVYPMAAERSLTLRLPPVQPRSRKAFEAAALARDAGQFDPMHRALFRAFFEDGRDLADPMVLLDVGQSVGLDEGALQEGLQSDRYTSEVRESQRQAQELGISGVPALVVAGADQAYLLSGAQPLETVRRVVMKAADKQERSGRSHQA